MFDERRLVDHLNSDAETGHAQRYHRAVGRWPFAIALLMAPGCFLTSLDGFSETAPAADAASGDDGGVETSVADVSASDAAVDAPPACAIDKPFTNVAPLSVPDAGVPEIGAPRLSLGERTMHFSGWNGAMLGTFDLYFATRPSPDGSFDAPQKLAVNLGTILDADPTVTEDGLELFFTSSRNGSTSYIHQAARTSSAVDFGAPVRIEAFTTLLNAFQPFISRDKTELWFVSDTATGGGKADIFMSRRTNNAFEAPTVVPEVSSPDASDWFPTLSADGLTLYFASARGGAKFHVWVARRATRTGTFAAPTAVLELNTLGDDYPGWLSDDQCRLYFYSNHTTIDTLYVATRTP